MVVAKGDIYFKTMKYKEPQPTPVTTDSFGTDLFYNDKVIDEEGITWTVIVNQPQTPSYNRLKELGVNRPSFVNEYGIVLTCRQMGRKKFKKVD